MTDCDHGITLAAYVERCAECGTEVVHRPPLEAELHAKIERLEKAIYFAEPLAQTVQTVLDVLSPLDAGFVRMFREALKEIDP